MERFLQYNVLEKETQRMSIPTIFRLVRFVLDNQWFIYNNNVYQQIHGGGSDTPLMFLLVNIILLDWQKEFVTHLKHKNEIFGR